MVFKDIWILFLTIPLIFFSFFLFRKNAKGSINFSSQNLLGSFKSNLRLVAAKNIFYLRFLTIALFIFALAGPRLPLKESKIQTEGVDIVLAIDSSGSMLAEDFKIRGLRKNRLEVVKNVAKDFIGQRQSDRIGIVTFAGLAYTVCPLTLDYDWLIENLARVESGKIEDGTAVGSAINSSLNRLKNTKSKSRIIILLTDGVNNAGKISPRLAAEAAKALGIKIYTIGVGTKGPVPYPGKDIFGRSIYQQVRIDIDEETLKEIAKETKGRYYRATDTESLKAIYAEIDSLETTELQDKGFRQYKELFSYFLILGLFFLILQELLASTYLRILP
tara:strand:+ start:444 stop:1439 length:996 start_codon:yes stop_codon:yes gene_type:complete